MRALQLIGFHALSAAPLVGAADWPHWRGVNFDGKTAESLGHVTSLNPLWKAEVGIGFSSFSVVGNRVYTMGNRDGQDTVWCLDAETGATLWKHTYACELDPKYYEGGPGATPTVTTEAVYTLSKKGHAFAFHPETGAVLWKRDLVADHKLKLPEWSFAGSPFVAGDLIVLNAGTAGTALDRCTGKTRWQSGAEATGYSTPVPLTAELGGPDATALYLDKEMAGIESKTGRVLWRVPWAGLPATDPLIMGAELFISSSAGSTVLRKEADGSKKPLWKRTDYQHYFNPPVKIGGHLYGLSGTTHKPTRFVCVEWATGKECWSASGHATGGIIATADLLVLCDKGEIVLVRPTPEKCDIVLRETVLPGKCWTAPVVAGGRIFARNALGRVVCLQPQR